MANINTLRNYLYSEFHRDINFQKYFNSFIQVLISQNRLPFTDLLVFYIAHKKNQVKNKQLE